MASWLGPAGVLQYTNPQDVEDTTQPLNASSSNLPDWMKTALGNVSEQGPGAASYVSTSGPQEFSKLKSMWDQSLGGAQAQLDPNTIKSLFGDSIAAAMQLGGEQINSAEGERGAAVRPGGVAQQKMTDLGLKVQQPLLEALLGNLNKGLEFNQGSLSKLFDSASGSQSNSMGFKAAEKPTTPSATVLPNYVQKTDPSASGDGADGAGGGAGGGGGSKGNKMPGGSSGGTNPEGGYTPGSGSWLQDYPSTGNFGGYNYGDQGYGDMPGMGAPVTDFWNEPGYPEGPNEFAGSGGGGLSGLYDDANQPGGAAAKPSSSQPDAQYDYWEIYGPERKGRAVSKSAYDAAQGAYDFYKTAR